MDQRRWIDGLDVRNSAHHDQRVSRYEQRVLELLEDGEVDNGAVLARGQAGLHGHAGDEEEPEGQEAN